MSMSSSVGAAVHPAVRKHQEIRRQSWSNRVADAITTFAGSMVFVYVHIVWFSVWMLINLGAFGRSAEFDKFPFGLLTMAVSLEAIFLSTFLLISQNRQDEARGVLANAEWTLVQKQQQENDLEIEQNKELLELSQRIFDLTKEIHDLTTRSNGSGPDSG
jgi:uncharacterized membrane protein